MINRDEMTITLTCEEEHTAVRGNVMCSGDDEQDRAYEDEIIRQLENGNEWAWCCAHVRVEWSGLKADDYLGGCSYRSRVEFIAGGYYKDMVDNCVDQIEKQASDIAARLKR